MPQQRLSSSDELILAMLRDVLARQAQQETRVAPALPPGIPETAPVPEAARAGPALERETTRAGGSPWVPEGEEPPEPLSPQEQRQLGEYRELAARPVAPGGLPRILRVLLAVLALGLLLINLPLLNGRALAQAMPNQPALIIRDGLLLKGSGPQVYVIENNHKRWISSLDAFVQYGYRWEDVHPVEDGFLTDFPDGRPVYLVLKCSESPHIYRIEDGRKRWIKDVPTLQAEGHVWADVRFTSCADLRAIPDGVPIPPDAGVPPQP